MNERCLTGFGTLLLASAVLSGWCLNINKLASLDFEQPYKTEAIRLAGLFPPIGIAIGWMTIGEEKKECGM